MLPCSEGGGAGEPGLLPPPLLLRLSLEEVEGPRALIDPDASGLLLLALEGRLPDAADGLPEKHEQKKKRKTKSGICCLFELKYNIGEGALVLKKKKAESKTTIRVPDPKSGRKTTPIQSNPIPNPIQSNAIQIDYSNPSNPPAYP